VNGLILPTAAEEAADLARADNAYRSAVEWLKERCRGKAYPLVEKENAEYGFRRNMRGLRALGAAASLVAFLASGFGIWRATGLTVADVGAQALSAMADKVLQIPTSLVWGVMLVDLIAMAFWLVVVRDRWVRQAGDQYARALLSNCESL
jgi:hypothetical protein